MPEQSIQAAVREHLRSAGLLGKGEKVILAVSGGLDSMVLLDLLASLRTDLSLELAVAHFNHLLRDRESDDDEAFVRAEAEKRGMECYVERANTRGVSESRKLSVQEAARDLRYAFFNKLRLSLGFQKIATAHHADDNAETILFNLIRGAGVHGLSGIPAFRRDTMVIRPLLCATREEIRSYAEAHALPHREDSSNRHSDYTRNYLRNELMPEIRRMVNPNLPATLLRTGILFDQLEQFLKDEAAKILGGLILRRTAGELVLDRPGLDMQPMFMKEHILLHLAREFSGGEVDFGTVRGMVNILQAETGTSCSLSKDAVFYRDRDTVAFRRVPAAASYRYHVEPGRSYAFEFFTFGSEPAAAAVYGADPNVEYVDAGLLGRDLTVRSWADGDWFVPLGMTDKKKLSDFFIDEKVPLFEKRRVPILLADDNIVWVCGKRLDDRYKVTQKTTAILKLTYTSQT
jgi:tRNA(Ile)-lysidine synthase